MEYITFKNQDVPLELCTLKIKQILLWENLEETTYIHVFKHFQIFIVDISIIYFYPENEAKRNC